MNFLKSLLHNIGVMAVGLALAFLSTRLDLLLGIHGIKNSITTSAGLFLLAAGFCLRVWATFYFYQHRMKVIVLEAQHTLITSGPYRFSRNPLYLGGNVFIFFGAGLLLGSPMMLILTALHLPLMNWFIRREEKQLERAFGEQWTVYKKRVRRWV